MKLFGSTLCLCFVAGTTLIFSSCKKEQAFENNAANAGGLSAKDTAQATVNATCGETKRPVIHAQLISVGKLSQTRQGVAVASAGNKILFAGGYTPNGTNSSRVDIYDLTTQTWSTAELSEARTLPAAIAAGNKIFFAGGRIADEFSAKTVDIYDVATNRWIKTALSIGGSGIAAAAAGNKVFFGGGGPDWERTKRVDIYNLVTNRWSISSFSVKRSGHAAVTVNNRVYFSGGETWPPNPVPGTWYTSKTIEVYDNATNSWSTSSLAQGKMDHAGIAVNDNIFWAGGLTGSFPDIENTCSVEIHNVRTGNVSFQKLSEAGYRKAVIKNNQVIFYDNGGTATDKFDVYDLSTHKWSIGLLPVKLSGGSIISVNNTIYLAGAGVNGVASNKVWKLKF